MVYWPQHEKEQDFSAKIDRSLLLPNELLTYLWYLNLRCTLKGLEVIQKFNNDDNDD